MAGLQRNKRTISKVPAAIPKRQFIASIQAAGRRAQTSAMRTMGFVIVVRGNDVIKKYRDGQVEVISQIS